MSLAAEEAIETQKLMQNESEEEEQKVPSNQAATSPVPSVKISSGAASSTSKHTGQQFNSTGNTLNESSKVSYINEKRLQREATRTNYTNKQKNFHKDAAADVRHMEKSLLELLDDFHTGKLSAFGSGCSMEQMMNIRDQQEHLAKLHFSLCADVDKTLDENFETAASREKMTHLVQKLEQLSTSIENLHSGTCK